MWQTRSFFRFGHSQFPGRKVGGKLEKGNLWCVWLSIPFLMARHTFHLVTRRLHFHERERWRNILESDARGRDRWEALKEFRKSIRLFPLQKTARNISVFLAPFKELFIKKLETTDTTQVESQPLWKGDFYLFFPAAAEAEVGNLCASGGGGPPPLRQLPNELSGLYNKKRSV